MDGDFEEGAYETAVDQLTTFIAEATGPHQAEGYIVRADANYQLFTSQGHITWEERQIVLRDLDSANELDKTRINVIATNLCLRFNLLDPIGFLKALFTYAKVHDKYM